jgi:uncharacterized protein YdgA (DUF945 family)
MEFRHRQNQMVALLFSSESLNLEDFHGRSQSKYNWIAIENLKVTLDRIYNSEKTMFKMEWTRQYWEEIDH